MASGHLPLWGRTALVTGGARRLGRAVAVGLAGAGANVVVHYLKSAAAAETAVEEIEAAGRRGWTVRADLGKDRQVEELVAQSAELAGAAVDVLINSASIFPAGRLAEMTDEDLQPNLRINAYAPLRLSHAFADQGVGGHIVNFLDCRIVDYDREHAAYHLSKRMLFAMTRMLAADLAPTIQVNAVAPGLILPPAGEDDSYLARYAHTNILQRHGDAGEIVRAVLFLLESRFVTGQVIYVDGGRHMKGSFYG